MAFGPHELHANSQKRPSQLDHFIMATGHPRYVGHYAPSVLLGSRLYTTTLSPRECPSQMAAGLDGDPLACSATGG